VVVEFMIEVELANDDGWLARGRLRTRSLEEETPDLGEINCTL